LLDYEKEWMLMIYLATSLRKEPTQAGTHLTKGFSLVELMVVVAVIGVLLATGLPSFNTWIQNSKIRGAAEAVLSGLQSARSEAIRRNARVTFTLLPAGGTLLWTVGCSTVTATCPAVIQTRPLSEGSLLTSGGAMVVSFDAGADTQVIFDSFGRANNLVAVAAWNVSSSAGDRPLRLIVDVGGSSRVCDPYLSTSIPGSCP
jgi:type IV fimbrial biogenesis protein FimT